MGCGASGNSMEYKFNAVHPQQLPKSGGTSGGSANNGSRRLVMPGGEGSLKKKAPVLALADFGNPRFNGLKQMISNKGSKTAFIRFLFTIKYSTSILQKYENLPRIQADVQEVEALCSEIVVACNEFLNSNKNNTTPPAEENNNNNNTGSARIKGKNQSVKVPTTYQELKLMLGAHLSEMNSNVVINIAIGYYPNFLKSEQYKEWKQFENTPQNTITSTVSAPAARPNGRDINLARLNLNLSNPLEVRVARKALSTVDILEIDRLLQSGSWISSLLLTVENLPVCVSLSTARKDRPGFPLIYVNACFERVTGYSRNEIVGQNCRFLQAGKAEPESIERLSSALRNAKPVRVAITNYRKDGMPFKNLLAMKPIFSESGEYRYVVGVQFDVTQDDATPEKLKLADEVLRMLPNVILNSEDDDDAFGDDDKFLTTN